MSTIQNLRESVQSAENAPSPGLPITDYGLPSPHHSPLTSSHFLSPGHLTLLLGHPGTGKSLLSLDIAARLSRGIPFSPSPIDTDDPSIPPLSVIASREDDPYTIECRLRAAGANLASTHILQHTSLLPLDPKPKPDADSHLLDTLADLLDQNPRLLILDPFPAFLENRDSTHATAIRNILQPLLQFSLECGITILGISHLNKSTRSEHPLHRANGSHAYTALARSVLLLTHDDLTFDPHRRLLIPLKNNFAPISHALSFTLHTSPNHEDSFIPPAAFLQWDRSPIIDHPLLSPTPTASPVDTFEKSQLDLAISFLQTTLAKGPVPSKSVLQQAQSIGISRSTLNRARYRLRIPVTHDGVTGQWIMSLP